VKVINPITKNEAIQAPLIYITIHKDRPSMSKTDKTVSDIQHIKVNTNTVYETSKPLLRVSSKPPLAVSIFSSAMPR
jgi:hypothetical protein